MKNICIIHLNQIGDLVFSLPLLKALREAYPAAAIHSIAKPYLSELLERVPYVDAIIERPAGLRDKLALVRRLRRSRYDLLIALAHSEESLLMTALSRAGIKAGFAHRPWDRCLDVKEHIEGHNGWYNNAKLLRRLQIPYAKDDYVGLLPVQRGRSGVALPETFAVYSPGASSRRQTKTWEDEKFAELMLRIWRGYGLVPVLVGGRDTQATTGRIKALLTDLDGAAGALALDLAGGPGLYALCSLLRDARLFVGIDSGVMHLAACLDVPTVGLYGPSDPFFVGPHNQRSRIVRAAGVDCAPCYLKPCDQPACMRRLAVEDVCGACAELLGASPENRDEC